MITNAATSFNFGLGETADLIRDTARHFAEDQIAPRAAEIDRSNVFPRDLWAPRGALGLHGVTVEEEYGGSGLGYLEHCVAMEEVSRARPLSASAMAPIPTSASTNCAATGARLKSGAICPNSFPASTWGRSPCRRRRAGSDARVHEDPRRQTWRPPCAQRNQDVDHQWSRRRRSDRLCEDRSAAGARGGSRPLSSKEASRDFPPRKSSTSWECAAPARASWYSRIAKFPPRMCWAPSMAA